MSEQLAQLEKKGGIIEKTLWTNPSPTSTFNSQNVTLSESMDNFEYLRVYWRASTTNASQGSIIFKTSELINGSNAGIVIALQSRITAGDTATYNRFIYRGSSTTISIVSAMQRSTSSIANSTVIPTKITGCRI